MTWEIAVAGTVHYDEITTPHGTRDCHGGSAVYFALAAARHAPVHLNGIVGRDQERFFREILAGLPVNLDGMVVSARPTFRWYAVHDFERWVTASERSEEGCDPEWTPQLPAATAAAPVLFLGSMRPHLQQAVLDQSRARLRGCDSMTIFTGAEHDAVLRVVEGCELLFLNRSELASLVHGGIDDWREQARGLCGRGRLRAVIVKGGPEGAACVTATAITELPAAGVTSVIDPTGAGDALAGGFLGACAAAERDDEAFFPTALAEGLRCASRAISSFGTADLRDLAATG